MVKYVPRIPGQTLLFIGQDIGSVNEYADNVKGGKYPSGVTTYTVISDVEGLSLRGLRQAVDYGAGIVHAQALVERFPNSALAIGLEIVDYTGTNLKHIADGTHDAHIDSLGEFIRDNAPRPVFLRIGYEFDGPWNHYEPKEYVEAFRHIVSRLRGADVKNFVSVWQSATSRHGVYKDYPITEWWPGADFVDWCGLSYFEFHKPSWDRLVGQARKHGKPIMVCESTPQGYNLLSLTHASVEGDGRDAKSVDADFIWQQWYEPFFQFIDENSDIVRSVAYINCNWSSQLMWDPSSGNGYWGDSRINANSAIQRRWEAQVNNPKWIYSNISDRLTSD